MKTLISLFLVILLSTFSLTAKDYPNTEVIKQIKQSIDDGYFSWSKDSFMNASALCQRLLAIDDTDPYANYYLSYSSYRLMNLALVDKNVDDMKKYTSLAKGHAAFLYDNESFKSEAHTLMAAILMMELAIDPSKGMEYSQMIHGHLGKAEGANPNNPRVNLIRGVMMHNTPVQFGGGANTSIGILSAADKQFMGQENNEVMPTWGKLETKAWIGQAQQQLGKFEDAKRTYENILEIKPDFNWVKYDLLPNLEKKVSQVNEKE